MCKPSRSEEPTSAEESAAFHAQAEKFFDSTAPKRAAKPPRSEVPESGDEAFAAAFAAASADVNNAERRSFELLRKSGEQVLPPPAPVTEDDLEAYHPTAYYTAVSVGHKHCPTGEAFIKLDAKQVAPVNVSTMNHSKELAYSRSESLTNPARDDWKRTSEQMVN